MDTIRERVSAVIRLILTILAGLNSVLLMKGMTPIPIDEEAVMTWAMHGVDAVIMLYCSWWKDNNITTRAIENKREVAKER